LDEAATRIRHGSAKISAILFPLYLEYSPERM
jgi:hypothetical protein